MSEWQLIACAPKERVDGKIQKVLLIAKYPDRATWSDLVPSWWMDAEEIYENGILMPYPGKWARWKHEFQPSHWMPEPPPPAEFYVNYDICINGIYHHKMQAGPYFTFSDAIHDENDIRSYNNIFNTVVVSERDDTRKRGG